MTIKTALPICEDCLCFTCWDKDCEKLACYVCELDEPVKDCPGYKGELKIG